MSTKLYITNMPEDVMERLTEEARSMGLTVTALVRMVLINRYKPISLQQVTGTRIQAARAEEMQQEALSSVAGGVSDSGMDAQVEVVVDKLRNACVIADKSGDRRQQVKALIKFYDAWYPATDKRWRATRLTEARAKDWLRKSKSAETGLESATEIYDFLSERMIGKEPDRPAVYIDPVMDDFGKKGTAAKNNGYQQQEEHPLDVFNHALKAGGMGELTLDDITAFAETQKRRGRVGKEVNGQ